MSPLFPSGRRSLEAALRDLDDPRAKVRRAAVEDLPAHAAEARARIVAALEARLASETEVSEVRAAAALALADVGAHGSVELLANATKSPNSAEVRQMALAALGELRAERATRAVAAALSDEEPEVRFQATMAHPRVCRDRDAAVARLLDATRDDDPLIAHVALRMAEELGPGEPGGGLAVPQALFERALELLEHEAPLVRIAAAIVVGRSNDARADDRLVDVAEGRLRTPEVADEAAALDLCGTRQLRAATAALERRAFPALLGLRQDPFAWQARVALAAMGHARAVGWVLRGLRSMSRNARTLAVAAAGRARLEAARPELERLRAEPSRVDPEIVADALRALDGDAPGDEPPRDGSDRAGTEQGGSHDRVD